MSVERSALNVERSAPHGAVFLSYAREDAAAARRIAGALRAAGVEVWFDQSELRGGDAWDTKLRRQIKDCALFVPLVSQHSEERSEGYFRREWKLAVDRTQDMAGGRSFIVPVVIDDTTESDAAVPEEFMRYQWTRLPGGEATSEFVGHVMHLLEAPRKHPALKPSLPRPPTLPPELKQAAQAKSAQPAAAPKKSVPPVALAIALGAVAVSLGLVFFVAKRDQREAAPAAPNLAAPAGSAPAAATDDKSIAVLPFANRSDDKDATTYFADGVHEDILTSLAKVRGLRVISRTSVMRFRDTVKPLPQIARELGVAYVLEGSVQRVGNKVRVTGQLIRAATDEHVWAEAYDRELTDVFEIQRAIAQEIARALAASLTPEEVQRVATRLTTNPRAQELFLKSRELGFTGASREESERRLREGVRLLEEAVRLDPQFVAAFGELVRKEGNMLFNRYVPESERPTQLERVRAALASVERLAPGSVQARLARGYFHYYAETDLNRGLAEFEAAQKLEPDNDDIRMAIALIHRRKGRWAEAVAGFEMVLQRDPLNRIAYEYGQVCYVNLRQERKADELLARALAAMPDDIDLAISRTYNAAIGLGDETAIDRFLGSLPAGYDPDGKISRMRYEQILNHRDYAAAEVMLNRPESPLIGGLRKRYGPGEPERTRALLAWLQRRPEAVRKHAQAALADVDSQAPSSRTLDTDWVLASAHALLGDMGKARQHLRAYVVAYEQGEDVGADLDIERRENNLLLYAGDYGGAIDLLEKRLARPDGPTVRVVRWNASYDCLKGDPRFEAVMKKAAQSQKP